MLRRASVIVVFALLAAAPAHALELANVSSDVASFDPSRGEVTNVRFRVSEPARVTLRIYDGRDLLVREVRSERELPTGDGALAWDGRDLRNRLVPSEAYHYTLEANGRSGAKVVWDLSDAAGGEALRLGETRWSPERGHIAYALPQTARVRIRVGLQNDGPLLHTLLDWVPRPAGAQLQSWDGKDASTQLDLSVHPALAILVEAFSLAPNTVLVGPDASEVELIPDLDPGSRRPRSEAAARKPGSSYASQMIDKRRDFPVRMELKESLQGASDGAPRVSEPARIRIDVDDLYRGRVEGERFEVVYFVDGRMIMENEVGFLPTTWLFDPRGLPAGVHHLSVNLRSYEGHIGVQTIAVHVDAPASTDSSSASGPSRP